MDAEKTAVIHAPEPNPNPQVSLCGLSWHVNRFSPTWGNVTCRQCLARKSPTLVEEIAEQFIDESLGYDNGITTSNLVKLLTSYGNQRYREGLEAAAKIADTNPSRYCVALAKEIRELKEKK